MEENDDVEHFLNHSSLFPSSGTVASIAPSATIGPASMKSPWTEGTYINCGGPALNGSVANWQADTYVTSGESFVQLLSSSFNNIATTDPGIFGSLRFFGAQGGPTNTYSIPVNIFLHPSACVLP